ncbi:MAG: ABC transporter permease [Bacteroides sp.]|nr:ABC transporter permease [Bacteroides sp.]
MIYHYIKIAFRNLKKYRLQTLLSVAGLAVGSVCFVLSVIWIRYEKSYDTFHKDADRMYVLRNRTTDGDHTINNNLPLPFVVQLRDLFPEIEACCCATYYREEGVDVLTVDSAYFTMFPHTLLAGNMDFMDPSNNRVAITQKLADRLFHGQQPLGQSLDDIFRKGYEVGAVLSNTAVHTNFPGEIITPETHPTGWNYHISQVVIKLRKQVDTEAFKNKLAAYEAKEGNQVRLKDFFITPLHELRHDHPNESPLIRLEHIYYFAAIGVFVIACSLVNTIMLLLSRFYNRQREMALRVVNGSARSGLVGLLVTEFFLILLLAAITGFLWIELILSPFLEVTGIAMSLSSFLGEVFFYYGVIALFSVLFFMGMTWRIRRRPLSLLLRKGSAGITAKAGIMGQLIISLLLIYCTVVIHIQLHYLFHTDLGFDFERTGYVYGYNQDQEIAAILAQLPGVEDILTGHHSFLPKRSTSSWIVNISEEGEPERYVTAETILFSPEFMDYYRLRLLEGRLPEAADEVVISEAFVKELNRQYILGKTFGRGKRLLRIVGVMQDVYANSPLIPPAPLYYQLVNENTRDHSTVLFRHVAGNWRDYRMRIEDALYKDFNPRDVKVFGAEEGYREYIRSEQLLLGVLTVVSLACVVISLFGVYSLISLACERRRKEIAVRKINGARVKDILRMFAGEYLLLLVVSVAVAFPVGYLVMNYWLEQYVKRTPVGVEIYVGIFLLLALLIVLCTGWKVWRAALTNPAEVVKSE